MFRRRLAGAALVGSLAWTACSSTPESPAPSDGGLDAGTPESAVAPCMTVFAEDFRDELGSFSTTAPGVGTSEGSLRSTLPSTASLGASAAATATAIVADARRIRVFYTVQVGRWPVDSAGR